MEARQGIRPRNEGNIVGWKGGKWRKEGEEEEE